MFEAHTQVTVYYTLLSIFVLIIATLYAVKPQIMKAHSSIITAWLAIFCIIFIGWRDWQVEDVFVDSALYGENYLMFASKNIADAKDKGFHLLQEVCINLDISVDSFFIVCALLYIFPQIVFVNKVGRQNAFILFLMMMTSLGFYSYGVNTVRNGLATSFVLLAFLNYKKSIQFVLYTLIALSFHKSILLPLLMFICATYYHKSISIYLYIWLLAIPLSFFIKNSLTQVILDIDFIADRSEGYLLKESSLDKFSKIGFRYDFLLYSMAPIAVGWWFIVKKDLKDHFYQILYCTYVLTNAFWVLINDVPFSDRFAHLSWFLMPILITYPFIYCQSIKQSAPKLALILITQLVFILII